MSEIDNKQVEEFFSAAASMHQNENAVLDVAKGQEHANIYRNFFTADYILKNIAPQKNQTVLDFGCGVGRVASMLADKVNEVVGVDSNESMITTARKKFISGNNVHYELLTSLKIPFEKNYFDTAFSHWVFQHINDEEMIFWLQQITGALKPYGKIYLFEQIKKESASTAKHLFRSPKHYLSLIEKAGLVTVSAFPVMRVPARGMSIWNKMPDWKFLLPLLSKIDRLTLNRKPSLADYFTYCFVLSKHQ